MDDRTKQSISALMDNEADELELQRLMSQLDNEDVQETWANYHAISSVAGELKDNSSFSIDISAGVAAAIRDESVIEETLVTDSERSRYDQHEGLDQEDEFDQTESPILQDNVTEQGNVTDISAHASNTQSDVVKEGRFKAWYAVAASVVLAVIFSVQGGFVTDQSGLNGNLVAGNGSNAGDSGTVLDSNFVKVKEQPLDLNEPIVVNQLDARQAKQLSRYLLRHAEHAVRGTQSGFVPLARVASVNSVGI